MLSVKQSVKQLDVAAVFIIHRRRRSTESFESFSGGLEIIDLDRFLLTRAYKSTLLIG